MTRKKRPRKRRRGSLYALAFIITLMAAVVLSLTVFFPINEINIKGGDRYPEEEIIAVSGISKDQNLFTCDTEGAARAIENSFPYLENVEVIRSLPGRITIVADEAIPIGAVKKDGGWVLLSGQGKVLETTEGDAQPPHIPEIRGIALASAEEGAPAAPDSERMNQLLELAAALRRYKIEKVYGYDFSERVNVKVNVGDRLLFGLGIMTEIDYKIRMADKLIREELDPADRGTVDLSAGGQGIFWPTALPPDTVTIGRAVDSG